MQTRIIDEDLALVPYYPNEEAALPWYQDRDVCKQVDNMDGIYTPEMLRGMYSYLNTHGNLYYIRYRDVLVGDVCLRDNDEVCIVVCKAYQNRRIGRRCIAEMARLAKEKGLSKIKAHIYAFNTQSQKMFLAAGFVQTDIEWYELKLT